MQVNIPKIFERNLLLDIFYIYIPILFFKFIFDLLGHDFKSMHIVGCVYILIFIGVLLNIVLCNKKYYWKSAITSIYSFSFLLYTINSVKFMAAMAAVLLGVLILIINWNVSIHNVLNSDYEEREKIKLLEEGEFVLNVLKYFLICLIFMSLQYPNKYCLYITCVLCCLGIFIFVLDDFISTKKFLISRNMDDNCPGCDYLRKNKLNNLFWIVSCTFILFSFISH